MSEINVIVTSENTSISVIEPSNSTQITTPTIQCNITSELISVNLSALTVTGAFSPLVFYFPNPSETWTVTHNIGRKVMPQIYTSGGLKMEGNILHLNDNVVQITFNIPISGYVIIV